MTSDHLVLIKKPFVMLVLAASLSVAQSQPAQNLTFELPPGVTLPPGVVLPEGALPPGVHSPARETGTNAPPATPEELRLQALLKLQFDRSPVAIMNALAERAKSPAARTNEVEQFEVDVVLADWSAVGIFLKGLPGDHGAQVYRHLLRELPGASQAGRYRAARPAGMPAMPQQQGPALPSTPALVVGDVLELIRIAPQELTAEDLNSLGQLLSSLVSRGDAIQAFVESLDQGVGGLGGGDSVARQRAAELLIAAGRLEEAGSFLPALEAAKTDRDFKTLELLARQALGRGRQPAQSDSLVRAWQINQFILTAPEATATNREPALKRAFELMPLVKNELGSNWLRSSFATSPAEGLAILSAVAEQVQQAAGTRAPPARQQALELQRRAVDAFFGAANPDQPEWRSALQLLALNWMHEAGYSKERWVPPRNYGPQYDQFGNMIGFTQPPQTMNHGNQVPPIGVAEMLTCAPGPDWIARLDTALQPAVHALIAELSLKADKPDVALEHIIVLAKSEPKPALALANQFIRAWGEQRNPMRQQQNQMLMQRYAAMGVYYGPGSPYGNRPAGIALTRALQQRNLRQFADILGKLEAASVTGLDERDLISAFTQCHSQAEVFRREDIELTFGPFAGISTGVLGELLQQMRMRLASQWRQPRIQQAAQTKRTDAQIEEEVLRGYDVVNSMTGEALGRDPDNWRLHLVRAAARFDLAEFRYGKKVDLAIYVEKREEAFNGFAKAAELYARAVPGLEEIDQSTQVFDYWFNATLGASDLSYVTRQQEPEASQLMRVREAINSLPGAAAGRHLSRFAAALANSANGLQPQLKARYLRAGLSIVGDHPDAEPARELVRYYDDLLHEIEFVVRLDGDATVGHGQPFGVFVSLRHTAELEREAGGFARYLRDPKAMNYYYNPMAAQQRTFLDEFNDQAREKLVDNFEVKVITFLDDKVQSRGYGRDGWRETPLAYFLLQAKDASADRIPPLRMDLDFTDQRGQVVLPVESSLLLIDSRPGRVEERPVRDVELTQVLDERELAAGLLTLEVKATGRGLVPELASLLRTNWTGLEITELSDNGLSISRMDTESEQLAPVSERNWLLKLRLTERATTGMTFRFAEAARPEIKQVFKRYADADLVEVDPEIALAGLPINPRPLWQKILFAALVGAGIGGSLLLVRRRVTKTAVEPPRHVLPDALTPFNVIALLRDLQADPHRRWTSTQSNELAATIQELESHFFSGRRNGHPEPDLAAIGQRWIAEPAPAG